MLKTKRLTLSPVAKEDLSFFLETRNDPETSYFLTTMVPINEYMQDDWFRALCLDNSRMYFTIQLHDSTRIGLVRCDEWDKINQSIRIGIDIAPAFRRNGYAKEAYEALLPYLFNHMHLHRIWLLVAGYNTVAQALYTALGFQEEGMQKEAIFRDGKYYNYHMMSLLKSSYETKN